MSQSESQSESQSDPTLESFADVIDRLGAGDQDAAEEIFKRFAGRLIGLARSRLDGFLRRNVDPEEVMQSVFKSFFRRQSQDEFQLEGWTVYGRSW